MIPVTVLTGFLGSGKTTLLGNWLRQPSLSQTALIINEFGEIGLDHHLIETSDESIVQLTTGCLCCAMRDDLVDTLLSLYLRRDNRQRTGFDRVIIETSGMADPTAICHALMTSPAVTDKFYLEHVIATLDSTGDPGRWHRYSESIRQIALADRLIVTKTDMSGRGAADLSNDIDRINTWAHRYDDRQVTGSPAAMFSRPKYNDTMALQSINIGAEQSLGHGHGRIHSHTLVRKEPISASVLALFLQGLTEQCGSHLLRLKGLVNVLESPGRPAVVHAVQHVLYPLQWLDRWPDANQETRLVLIGEDLPLAWVDTLLETIILEAEFGME